MTGIKRSKFHIFFTWHIKQNGLVKNKKKISFLDYSVMLRNQKVNMFIKEVSKVLLLLMGLKLADGISYKRTKEFTKIICTTHIV